ncbi:MAG TPA: acyltransferase [Leeuwenhoekiella sp.]|nr:acyltransferase [Leeuwenhoekiella sp.]
MLTYFDKKIQQVQDQEERLRKDAKKPFLQHIHYFRGFAIINIVMIHLLFAYLAEHVKLFEKPRIAVELIFADSTIYFILIAGFLFSYLAYKVRIKSYYQVKFKNVILPYIIITFLITVLKNWHELIDLHFLSFFSIFIKHVVLGTALIPFWYIPFVAVVFFISPFFLMLSDKTFKKITLFAIFLPLLGTRPSIDLTAWHFIYYVPIYMLGMLIARNYSEILEQVMRYKVWLYVAIVVSSLIVTYNLWLPEESYFLQTNVHHSLLYIQKLGISFLLLNFLKRFDSKKINWLDYLAVYSFSIYFLHTIVQYPVQKIMYLAPLRPYIDKAPVVYIFFVGVVILLVTLLVCIVLKRIFGRYSRMLIGT